MKKIRLSISVDNCHLLQKSAHLIIWLNLNADVQVSRVAIAYTPHLQIRIKDLEKCLYIVNFYLSLREVMFHFKTSKI